MQIAFLVVMFVVGAAMGSFLCCQVRRMREKEVTGKKLGNRSVCMSCGRKLKWYENIPIISWVALGGKCKKCGKPIGVAEILSEVLMGMGFVLLGLRIDVLKATGLEWGVFVVTAILVLDLGFLAIYDGLYGELPGLCLTFGIICAIIKVILENWNLFFGGSPNGEFPWSVVGNIVGAVGILGGIYLLLYLVSRGKWVGDGDWILGVIIGIALGSPWLALIELFLANFLATIVMFPALKKNGSRKIYFGPFLVAAFLIVYATQPYTETLVTML